jgi:coenzyme Q-binding protein COQ10
MATLKSTRPFIRSFTRLQPSRQQRRTFLPNPFEALSPSSSTEKPPPQILTAVRTLPYPSAPVYSIIADVPNYSSFLPYCQRSEITKWSAPDKEYGRRWPSEGLLTSGFGGMTESFVSRVYCVPGRYVESVGGDTNTSLKAEMIAHHLEGSEKQDGRQEGENGLLTHLRSKWTIEAMQEEQTQVSLAVEFAFSNPMYAALSGGVAPKVAEFMVKAFEKRVQEILEENPEMVKASLAEMDGSRLKR